MVEELKVALLLPVMMMSRGSPDELNVARIEGVSTCPAGQVTLSSSVPLPESGVTLMATVVVEPLCTSALPTPCPMSVPSVLNAFTLTVQLPKARELRVTVVPVVLWEKLAPLGPEPLREYETGSMLREGTRVRETCSPMVMVRDP